MLLCVYVVAWSVFLFNACSLCVSLFRFFSSSVRFFFRSFFVVFCCLNLYIFISITFQKKKSSRKGDRKND